MTFRFVQNGADTEIYLDYSGLLKSDPEEGPLRTLQGGDATLLSLEYFLF